MTFIKIYEYVMDRESIDLSQKNLYCIYPVLMKRMVKRFLFDTKQKKLS